MNIFIPSKFLAYSLLIALLGSLNANAAATLKIVNAWIPEAPPGANVMAGYMEIQNNSNKAIDIVSINSDAFASIEMHRSMESDGFAKMLPQKTLRIRANDKLVLKSGSYHLMLIKPIKWFRHGNTVELTFTLSNNESQTISISIKKNKKQTMKCAAGKCGAQ